MKDSDIRTLIQALGLSLIAAGVVGISNSFFGGIFAILIGIYILSRSNRTLQRVTVAYLEKVRREHPERDKYLEKIEWFYEKIMGWKVGAKPVETLKETSVAEPEKMESEVATPDILHK